MSRSMTITVRVDPEAKEQAERIYQMFGMTLSDAINMLLHKTVMENGLPFDLRASKGSAMVDSVSSEPDMDELRRLVCPAAEKAGARKLILFGPRARGDFTEDSRYEFCVDLESYSEPTVTDLLRGLEKAIGGTVELNCLGEADEKVLSAVISEGITVYERRSIRRV